MGQQHLPVFEFLLLGGIADAVKTIGARSLISERDASNVFSAAPQAAAMAMKPQAAGLVPHWPQSPTPALQSCRTEILRACPLVAERPAAFMEALIPALQGELSHYAGNRTVQIRSCWVWTMYCLVATAQGPGADATWAFPVLGEAVQVWEHAVSGS